MCNYDWNSTKKHRNIENNLRELDAELTEWWKNIYDKCKSNELFTEYETNYKNKDPYTMLAAEMGMFSGITAVQRKIQEILDVNKK